MVRAAAANPVHSKGGQGRRHQGDKGAAQAIGPGLPADCGLSHGDGTKV